MKSSATENVEKPHQSFKGYAEDEMEDNSPVIKRNSYLQANKTPQKSKKSTNEK